MSIDPVDIPDNHRKAVENACVQLQPDLLLFLTGILRNHHLADDAWQRTVVLALQSSHSARIPTLRGWLFQIALNEARKILREIRKLPTPSDPASFADFAPSAIPQSLQSRVTPDSQVISNEISNVVQECLKTLPSEQQEVIRQRVYFGRTFSEIASDLNLPLGTVLTWCRRGLLRLKDDPRIKDLLKD